MYLRIRNTLLVGFTHCSNHLSLPHHHCHCSPSPTPQSSMFHLVLSLCHSSDSQSIPRSLSGLRQSSVGLVPSPSDFSLLFSPVLRVPFGANMYTRSHHPSLSLRLADSLSSHPQAFYLLYTIQYLYPDPHRLPIPLLLPIAD